MSHILKSQLFSLSVNVAPGTQIGQVLDRLSVGRAAVTAFFAFVILLATSPLFAAEPVAKSEPDGVAIGGHDTVAYHGLPAEPHEQAIPGQKTYTVEWKGAKWRFLNEESANKFRAEPERYSPAFNGHCANALSLGRGLLKTDGTHWEIFGDQLYLFFAARGRDRWIATDNVQPYIEAAELAWSELK